MRYKERTLLPIDMGRLRPNDRPGYPNSFYKSGSIYTWDPAYHDDKVMEARVISSAKSTTANLTGYNISAERIQYEVGKDKFNYCRHHRNNMVLIDLFEMSKYVGKYNPGWRYDGFYNIRFSPTSVIVNVPGAYQPDLLFSGRAWWQMQPRLDQDFSMINFLFEMKDFRDIAKNLFTVNKKFGTAWKRHKAITPKGLDPSRPIAEGILLYNFAIRPLIQDISELILAAKTIAADAFKDFAGYGEQPRTVHYSEWPISERSLSWLDNKTSTWSGQLIGTGSVSSVKFTATLERTYSYAPQGAMKEFLKYWGWEITPRAIWNAMPFSFLLDYVIGVDKALRSMETQKGVDMQVLRYCESAKSVNSYGYHAVDNGKDIKYCGNSGTFKLSEQKAPILLSGVYSSYYERVPKQPHKGAVLPRFKLPSSRQLLNVLALARCLV